MDDNAKHDDANRCHASMPPYLYVPMPPCLYVLCLYASMSYASMSLCLYGSMSLCLYASMPLCLYASMPLCLAPFCMGRETLRILVASRRHTYKGTHIRKHI